MVKKKKSIIKQVNDYTVGTEYGYPLQSVINQHTAHVSTSVKTKLYLDVLGASVVRK